MAEARRLTWGDNRLSQSGPLHSKYAHDCSRLPPFCGMIQAMSHSTIYHLDDDALSSAALELAAREPFFAAVLDRYGLPPLWARPTGFSTLVWIILEQQVSLASARAAFERVRALLPEFSPEAFLALSDSDLRSAGFSRQKTAYSRGLAEAVISGELDLERLNALDDHTARADLMRLKGIGRWTADIYLLMALCRPDIWPAGDLGLAVAIRCAFDLPRLPTPEEMRAIGAAWKPYRAVAARLLWQYYLNDLQSVKRKADSKRAENILSERVHGSSLDRSETRAKL